MDRLLRHPLIRPILRRVARVARPILRALPIGRRLEGAIVRQTWSVARSNMLDSYLVSGYQNPRINVQSIMLRHFLVRRLFGDEYNALMDEELRFAVELNEVLRTRAAELDVKMGSFLDPVKQARVREVDAGIADREREFETRWSAALGEQPVGQRLKVLELACGSANDYRYFADYGLARHLEYRGVDLTPKNIENARRRFPGVDFQVGNILDLKYPDESFDYVIASDIFEHFAIDAMERALREALRLSRRGVALVFFNMHDSPEHSVQPRNAYYWNRLSRPRIEAIICERYPAVSIVPIGPWLREHYGYRHSMNQRAYSIFATEAEDPPAIATPPETKPAGAQAEP